MMMEVKSFSETPVSIHQLHSAAFQKAAIFGL
jgi:hypothetical protein